MGGDDTETNFVCAQIHLGVFYFICGSGICQQTPSANISLTLFTLLLSQMSHISAGACWVSTGGISGIIVQLSNMQACSRVALGMCITMKPLLRDLNNPPVCFMETARHLLAILNNAREDLAEDMSDSVISSSLFSRMGGHIFQVSSSICLTDSNESADKIISESVHSTEYFMMPKLSATPSHISLPCFYVLLNHLPNDKVESGLGDLRMQIQLQ